MTPSTPNPFWQKIRDDLRPKPPPDFTVTLIARFRADPHLQRLRLITDDETTPGALFVKRRRMAEFCIGFDDSDLAVISLSDHDGRLEAAGLLMRKEDGVTIIEPASAPSRRQPRRQFHCTLKPNYRLVLYRDGMIAPYRRDTAQAHGEPAEDPG